MCWPSQVCCVAEHGLKPPVPELPGWWRGLCPGPQQQGDAFADCRHIWNPTSALWGDAVWAHGSVSIGKIMEDSLRHSFVLESVLFFKAPRRKQNHHSSSYTRFSDWGAWSTYCQMLPCSHTIHVTQAPMPAATFACGVSAHSSQDNIPGAANRGIHARLCILDRVFWS